MSVTKLDISGQQVIVVLKANTDDRCVSVLKLSTIAQALGTIIRHASTLHGICTFRASTSHKILWSRHRNVRVLSCLSTFGYR